MNKERLKETLFAMQKRLIDEFDERVATSHTMVDLDESDTIDPEDFSHQYESREMEELMQLQLNKAKRNFELLKSIDFGPKKKVEQGALVVTQTITFFVGFPAIPFEMDGMHVVGISKASPLYTCILDKQPGESFSYCGKEYSIEKIY